MLCAWRSTAFERAKAEKEKLERLHGQLADQKPHEAESRTKLEGERAQAKTQNEGLEKGKGALEDHLRWHEAWERAKRAEREAQGAEQKALAERDAATGRRSVLARVESVQAARPKLSDLDRAATEQRESVEAAARAQAVQAQTVRVREQGELALKEAADKLRQAEEGVTALAPEIERARALDAQIESMTPNHQALRKARDEAQADAVKTEASRQAKERERQQAQSELKTAQEWLAANAQLQSLAVGWLRWDTLFTQAGKTFAELAQTDAALKDLQKEEAAKRGAHAKAVEAKTQAEAKLTEAETALKGATDQCARFDTEAMAGRRAALEARRDALAGAEGAWRELVGRQSRHDVHEAKQKELAAALAQAHQKRNQATEQKGAAEREFGQAERSLRVAEAACHESVESLRAQLQPETPCPVCGSPEHPYAVQDPQLRAALEGLRAEGDRCRKALDAISREEATQKARAEGIQAQLGDVQQELRSLIMELEKDRQRWSAHPVSGELAGVASEERANWLVTQMADAQRVLKVLAEEEGAHRKASRQKEAAQKSANQASETLARAKDAATKAAQALDQAVNASGAAVTRRAEADARLEGRLAELDGAFPDQTWREAWRASPGDFHAAQAQQVQAWTVQEKAVDALGRRIGALDVELQGLVNASAKAAETAKRVRANFEDADRVLLQKQSERKLLLGGRKASDVKAALAQAVEEAKKAFDAQRQIEQQARETQARVAEALRQEQALLQKRQEANRDAQAALAAWIANFNAGDEDAASLDADELRTLLARDAAWIGEERRTLQLLETAIETARAVLNERRSSREAHAQRRPTLETAQALQEAHAKIRGELESAKNRLAALEVELAKDDERRQKSAALLEVTSKQEAATRVWAQLNELIGAADGKKFRNVAQQLTLDVLLGYANPHLADLWRRYRLERVKDSLALLVVDRDMGDEIRSVHSLSGGESFLVSLALALGLASLSSHRVRVESLFIDEGFGSLDADALSVAMEALDSLQATGRKVAVISHVQEMSERIRTQVRIQPVAGGQSRVMVSFDSRPAVPQNLTRC